jgi:hypothetical protein
MAVAAADLKLTSAAIRELGRNQGLLQREDHSQAKVVAAWVELAH